MPLATLEVAILRPLPWRGYSHFSLHYYIKDTALGQLPGAVYMITFLTTLSVEYLKVVVFTQQWNETPHLKMKMQS